MNRRDLFKTAALAGAGALAQQTRAAPNDRIGIGVIGCGAMGRMDLADFHVSGGAGNPARSASVSFRRQTTSHKGS